jgi:hypothetical protein
MGVDMYIKESVRAYRCGRTLSALRNNLGLTHADTHFPTLDMDDSLKVTNEIEMQRISTCLLGPFNNVFGICNATTHLQDFQ